MPVSAIIRVSTGWDLGIGWWSRWAWATAHGFGLYIVLTLDIIIILIIIVIIEIILIALLIIIIKVLASILPTSGWWAITVPTSIYGPGSRAVIVIGLGTGLTIGRSGP